MFYFQISVQRYVFFLRYTNKIAVFTKINIKAININKISCPIYWIWRSIYVEKLTDFGEKAVLFLFYLRICAKCCTFVVGFAK